MKISCVGRTDVKFFSQNILKRTFFHLNLHKILNLLVSNLLVLHLITGLKLNLTYLNVESKQSGCEFNYFVLLACKKISENYNDKKTKEKYFLMNKERE